MKVGIVEDQMLYQRYLSEIVVNKLGFEVVLCTGDAVAVLEAWDKLEVDLLILDLKIQRMYGLELAEALLERNPNLKILAYSGEVNSYNLRMIGALGIQGYLDKSDPVMVSDDFFIEAIRNVSMGKHVYSPGIEKSVRELSTDDGAFHKVLSPRKIEILNLIAKCMTDDEIAQITSLSNHTVRKHRTDMMRYLNLDSTHSLIRYAQQHGFGNQSTDDT